MAEFTAADVVRCLNAHYQERGWLAFAELRVGTGYGKDAETRLDYWAMEPLPSKRFRRVAFEIKVGRSDFLAELRQPLKRRRALLLSNEFYFITPPGLVKASELPPECGLAEVRGEWVHFLHAAPWRDTVPPTWQFLAAVIRRATKDHA
jgi:hypothetical protein